MHYTIENAHRFLQKHLRLETPLQVTETERRGVQSCEAVDHYIDAWGKVQITKIHQADVSDYIYIKNVQSRMVAEES